MSWWKILVICSLFSCLIWLVAFQFYWYWSCCFHVYSLTLPPHPCLCFPVVTPWVLLSCVWQVAGYFVLYNVLSLLWSLVWHEGADEWVSCGSADPGLMADVWLPFVLTANHFSSQPRYIFPLKCSFRRPFPVTDACDHIALGGMGRRLASLLP